MKNIWIFNHYSKPLSVNDSNRHTKFAKYLARRGFNVTIFCSSTFNKGKSNLISDKRCFYIDDSSFAKFVVLKTRNYKGNGLKRILNMFDYYRNLMKSYKKVAHLDKPDVVYASSVHPLALVGGIKISKKLNVKVISEVRDLWPLSLVELGKIKENSLIARIMYKFEKRLYIKSDRLVFTMSGGYDYIIDKKWDKLIPKKKVYYLNNNVDLETYTYNRDTYIYDDEVLNNEDLFKIVYTGSIGIANNIQKILDAANYIEKQYKEYNIMFLIFGDGPKKNELEKFCLENKLANVKFYGKVSKNYIPYILSKSNGNIFTVNKTKLLKYGISLNKLFDYAASEKPIFTDFQSKHNLLEEYEIGLNINMDNAQSLGKAIVDYFENSTQINQKISINYKRFLNDYNTKTMTERLISLLMELSLNG